MSKAATASVASIGILRDLQEILQSDDEDAKESVRLTIKALLTNVRRAEVVKQYGLVQEAKGDRLT